MAGTVGACGRKGFERDQPSAHVPTAARRSTRIRSGPPALGRKQRPACIHDPAGHDIIEPLLDIIQEQPTDSFELGPRIVVTWL
jgi:hypothetical protein